MAGAKKGYILHTLVSFVPLDSAEKHTSELKKLCRHCCLKMVCQTWLVTLNVKEGVSTFDQLNSHIIWTCDKHMSLPIIKLLNNTSTGIPWIPWLNCYSLRFQSADERSANQWSSAKLKNSWERKKYTTVFSLTEEVPGNLFSVANKRLCICGRRSQKNPRTVQSLCSKECCSEVCM